MLASPVYKGSWTERKKKKKIWFPALSDASVKVTMRCNHPSPQSDGPIGNLHHRSTVLCRVPRSLYKPGEKKICSWLIQNVWINQKKKMPKVVLCFIYFLLLGNIAKKNSWIEKKILWFPDTPSAGVKVSVRCDHTSPQGNGPVDILHRHSTVV